MLATGCSTPAPPNDDWLGRDKFLHLGASAALAAGASSAAYAAGMNDTAIAAGGGVSLAAGLAKETFDVRVKGTGWSWKDLAWDALGACLGATAAGLWQ